MEGTTKTVWRVRMQAGDANAGGQSGARTFDDRREAEKLARKLESLAGEAGLAHIYFAEPAV